MLARRIIAISSDPGFGSALAAAVPDPVEVQHAVDAPAALDRLAAIAPGQAALCVIHVDGAASERWSGLAAGCPVLVVCPGASLASVVALMQASDRIAGVLTAAPIDPRGIAALAAHLVADAPLGLAQAIAPDAQIHTRAVADYQARTLCLQAVARLVEQAGVPRGLRAPIEQCLDELVMNALYDAPVDAGGQPLFAGIDTRARIALRTEHSAQVQYACDGKRLALSVRDGFGALGRTTVLRHLHKGLHAAQQIERKVAGAGLGLYLIANAATALSFHVVPGVATEVLCVFDLEAPGRGLAQLGFVQRDPAEPRAPARARRFPARSRLRGYALPAAIVAIIAVLGVLVLARHRTATPPATVELDSQPSGARVAIDGVSVGSTPVAVTTLVPGASVSIAFQRTGYRDARARLQVPGAGGRTRLVQPLELSDAFVRVRFVSTPPGAEVVKAGRASTTDHTYTPADVFVEVDQVQRFTLTMPGHVPLVIEPFVPIRGATVLEKGGSLAEGANLHIEATLPGKVTVSGAPACQDLVLPADCTVAPGRYDIVYTGPRGARITRSVVMTTQDAVEKL